MYRQRILEERLARMAVEKERKEEENRRRRAEEERRKMQHEIETGKPASGAKFTAAEASSLPRSSSAASGMSTSGHGPGSSGPVVRDPFRKGGSGGSSRGGPGAPTPTGALPAKYGEGPPASGIGIAGGPSTRDAVLARREAMRAAKQREERATLAAAAQEGARERQAAIEKHKQQI